MRQNESKTVRRDKKYHCIMIKGFAHFGSTYVYTNDKGVNSSGDYNNCKYICTQLNKVNINRTEGINK